LEYFYNWTEFNHVTIKTRLTDYVADIRLTIQTSTCSDPRTWRSAI
jgi:hypothetical protein